MNMYIRTTKKQLHKCRKTSYDIAKQHPDAFKWGERRELLNRLKAELKI